MGMHVLRGTVAAVETLAVVGMQEVYYLVQRDALARVADKVVEVRVADNPLAFQAPTRRWSCPLMASVSVSCS